MHRGRDPPVAGRAPSRPGAAHARIAERGAILSEVGEGGPFGKGAFVKRNRLIAACSAATVVVEAAEDGGGLTTAAVARALGRPVLAVPGDLDRPASRGTLELLRTGARVCGDAGDVLAAMGPLPVDETDPEARLRMRSVRQRRAVGARRGAGVPRRWRAVALPVSGLARPAGGLGVPGHA